MWYFITSQLSFTLNNAAKISQLKAQKTKI